MKVGDAVMVTDKFVDPYIGCKSGYVGIIIDTLELEDGFSEYEVLLEDGDVTWYSDLMLKLISASR
jgi:hypothetical protein